MVFVLTTHNGSGHIDGFCKSYDRSYGRTMNEMTYQDVATRGIVPAGVYIFGDRWRMNPLQLKFAAMVWDQLGEAGDRVRRLNSPTRQLDRVGLLRMLREEGINDFDVYRATELPAAMRFPVFVRRDDDHAGPKTGLISTRDDLEAQLTALILAGHDPRRLIVIEYTEVVSPDGAYRKYGAMRVGDVLFAHHIMLAREWHTKAAVRIRTEESIDESDAYTLANPHADIVMPIFERAGIEYGRMDYGMIGGRIQVWEINDNPVFMHGGVRPHSKLQRHVAIKAAFDKLAEGMPRGNGVELDFSPARIWGLLRGGSEAAI